jgi:hypothetical protein
VLEWVNATIDPRMRSGGMDRQLIHVIRCLTVGGRMMHHFSRQLFGKMGMAFIFITPGAIASTTLRLL